MIELNIFVVSFKYQEIYPFLFYFFYKAQYLFLHKLKSSDFLDVVNKYRERLHIFFLILHNHGLNKSG